MKITAKSWNEYTKKLSQLNQKAGALMREYIGNHGTDDTKAIMDYAMALIQKYGEGSAELACQMYDSMAEMAGVSLPSAEPAEVASYKEVAKMVNATKESPLQMERAVSRMVKRAGADTTLKNAIRDKAEFAWVPHGDTCSFCITLASRGWQRASEDVLKGNHAEHIHSNCDCEYAIRFSKNTDVEGYDPDKYLEQYKNADGKNTQAKINAMRRENYAKNKDSINARKRELYAEAYRRKTGEQGQEIIDKPTYNKLTSGFIKRGGIIIRGEDAKEHLEKQGAYASYMAGGNFAFIRDDATVSDVLEEMYHAEQDRKRMFSECPYDEIIIRREINAQEYLLSVAEKYKISAKETKTTEQNLVLYKKRLKELLKNKGLEA